MEQRLKTSNMIQEERMSKNEDAESKEEECNHYIQRCKVLKALNDRYRADMITYKRKIQGVDSLAQLFKESRQENVALHKHNKSLQSAVNNLQRRLSKNGLSASPSLQDTELFIPGASKQTLDNLAKENMRLRNLLKNGNGQSEKKSTNELDEMKAVNERLESENNLLKQDVETYKQQVADLSKKKDEEKVLVQQEPMQVEANKNEQDSRGEAVTRTSVGCQALNLKADEVSEIRELLKATVRQCSQFDQHLQQSLEMSQTCEGDKIGDANLKTPVLVDEDYQKLKTQLLEAQIMNQRWNAYSQTLNNKILTLTSNCDSLKREQEHMNATTHQEEIRINAVLGSKDNEIRELKKQSIGLSREVQELRGQVELYKQQIRVCTEDFNTERKDREVAVQKAKTLHDENMKLKAELDRLKVLNNVELMSRLQQPVQVNPQSVPQRRYEFVQERGPSGQLISGNQPGYNMTHAMSEAPSLSPHIPEYTHVRQRQAFPDSVMPQNQRIFEAQSLPRQVLNDANLGSFHMANAENNLLKNNLSMPTVGGRSGLGQEKVFSCPKCNKEFPEKSSADLLTHIDMCKA